VKVGDLVRIAEGCFSVSEKDWIGMIIDFHIRVDNCGEPQERYAVVWWNSDFTKEEEYLDSLVVINGS
jgi:hypothetical protein